MLVEKCRKELSIFWLKSPCKSYFYDLLFKLFFFENTLQTNDFGVFFGRRPYGRSLFVEFVGSFFVIFHVLRGVPHKALCLKKSVNKK